MTDNPGVIIDEYGEYDDWFELYNGNTQTYDLRGLFISDDNDHPTKYQIPYSEKPLNLYPEKQKVFWADNQVYQGNNHVNFKLDNEGEKLILSYTNGKELITIDKIDFGLQKELYSYGREYDGVNLWMFQEPSPGRGNNYSRMINIETFTHEKAKANYKVYPNPTNSFLFIEQNGQDKFPFNKQVQIFDITGKMCINESIKKSQNICKFNVHDLKPGIYILRITVKDNIEFSGKISIIK